jgi:ATP-binding cassette subfamily C protein
MGKESLKLFKLLLKVIIAHPFPSTLFFVGVTFVGVIQVVSIGALYPIIYVAIGKSGQSNFIIKYTDSILNFLGLEIGLVNYLLMFLLTAFFSGVIFVAVEAQQAAFLKKIEIKEGFSIVEKVLGSQWKILRNLNHEDFINATASLIKQYKTAIKYSFLVVSAVIQVIVYFCSAFIIDLKFTLISIAASPIVMIASYSLLKKSTILGHEWTQSYNQLYKRLLDAVRTFKNIKSGSLEKFASKYIGNPLYSIFHVEYKQHVLMAVQTKVSELAGYFTLSLLIYISIKILTIDPGSLILVLFIIVKIVPQIRSINDNYHRGNIALPSIEKIQKLRDYCSTQTKSSGKPIEDELCLIAFHSVDFRYDTHGMLFDDLNLEFRKGEFWAICGPTGAGKTTILDLLSCIIGPSGGSISYNGIPYSDIEIKSLHQRVGYLTQDHFIFAGTLLDNICWGKKDVEKSCVDRAIRLSQLGPFVREKTLDFLVSESGQNLSGGQQQRIAIARLLLKNYDFILMDEPTSALDKETEQNFVSALMELKGKCGIIMVTHRKEFLKCADHVLSIESGILKLNGKII